MIGNIHKMHFNEYSTDIIYFPTYLNHWMHIQHISYLSNHNNYEIYINKPQSSGFFVGTMKGPHEYGNGRDTLHHFEMHSFKFKASLGQGSNNYVELFPSKSWLNLHKRGLWNKFKYLMILVSSLVGCKKILEPIIIILVLL